MAIQLVQTTDADETPVLADSTEIQDYILTQLATTFSDDSEFLRKINKLTFGLISK